MFVVKVVQGMKTRERERERERRALQRRELEGDWLVQHVQPTDIPFISGTF